MKNFSKLFTTKRTYRKVEKYFCDVLYFKYNISRKKANKEFLNVMEPLLDKSKREVFVVRSNIGKTFLLAYSKDYWYDDNNSQVIITKKIHKNIFDVFAPNIKYQFLDAGRHNIKLSDSLEFKDYKITLWPGPNKYPRSKGIYYIFCKYMNIKENMDFPDFYVSNYKKAYIRSLLKDISINYKKEFVIIAPYAQSQQILPEDFWHSLVKNLRNKGYEVFFNSKGDDWTGKYPHAFLNIGQMMALSELASAFISIRSGLCEPISIVKKLPQHIIYTDKNKKDFDYFYKLFNFKQYPWFHKNIHEYFYKDFDIKTIENNIIKKL